MKTLFCYGSLRRGFWNHGFLDPENSKFVGIDEIKGKLYAGVYPFPHAYEEDGKIVGEIWEVEDQTFYRIAQMEIQAGYYFKEVKTLRDDIPVTVFFHKDKRFKQGKLYEDFIDALNDPYFVENTKWFFAEMGLYL